MQFRGKQIQKQQNGPQGSRVWLTTWAELVLLLLTFFAGMPVCVKQISVRCLHSLQQSGQFVRRVIVTVEPHKTPTLQHAGRNTRATQMAW
jgi:hypothetical protein